MASHFNNDAGDGREPGCDRAGGPMSDSDRKADASGEFARPVTMAEVADAAGVSIATVSRVLNSSRPVRDDLREVVVEAATRLGYQINLVGRALRLGRSATVGLIVPDLDNPFFSSLAQYLSDAFTGSGTDVLVFSAADDPAIERRGVESFLGRQVDAIVIIPCHEADSAESVRLADQSTLTIQLDRRTSAKTVHFIGCDNAAGIDLIAEHARREGLADTGPLIFVGAAPSASSSHQRTERFTELFPDAPTYLGRFDWSWGLEAVDQILADGHRRGTIVAAADVIALGVLSRLHERQLHVPKDFRVIGFDGIGMARFASPTLTTIRQPVEEISATVRTLVTAHDRRARPRSIIVRPELIVGESSPEAR